MELNELKDMTNYIVEVAFNQQNPIHRATCFHQVDGHVTLFGSYDTPVRINIRHLAYFRIVSELAEMNDTDYTNHMVLPRDASGNQIETLIN